MNPKTTLAILTLAAGASLVCLWKLLAREFRS